MFETRLLYKYDICRIRESRGEKGLTVHMRAGAASCYISICGFSGHWSTNVQGIEGV